MGKSKALIQKQYRERKKANDKNYLAKEALRQTKYYTPAQTLSKTEAKERREATRERVRQCRQRKGEIEQQCETADECVAGPSGKVPLVVSMDFRRCNARKRISRSISRSKKEIAKLREENENLRRRTKTLQKRVERSDSKEKHPPVPVETGNPLLTPMSRTNSQIRECGMSPSALPTGIRKRLLLNNAICDEIKAAKTLNKSQHKTIRNVIAGKIVKKYRCLTSLSKDVQFSRKSLTKGNSKILNVPSREGLATHVAREALRETVVAFLERDDNSRAMPGKKDVKKVEKGRKGRKVQKRLLNDYLKNLFVKFTSENVNIKISKSVFCTMRPKYITLVNFTSKNACLCLRHQNMALMLKAAASNGATCSRNPDVFIQSETKDIKSGLAKIKSAEITYMTWEKMKVVEQTKRGEKEKTKTKLVPKTAKKNAFIKSLLHNVSGFKEHVLTLTEQYRQMKILKERLPKNHVIVQMDFAEDYDCAAQDEVQSGYYNRGRVTLHPCVVYFRYDSGMLDHRSFVFVSDVKDHTAPTIYTILQRLVSEIREFLPNLTYIHYWTDSPTSQYRNRYMFYVIAKHNELLRTSAQWNYFEAGHGKGPCDGIGGTAKRLADDAVKHRKCSIQDSFDFFAWAEQTQQTGKIKYIFIFKEDVNVNVNFFKERKASILGVQGTMRLHAVVSAKEDTHVYSKETSCYRECCFTEQGTFVGNCAGWKLHKIEKRASCDAPRQEQSNATKENEVDFIMQQVHQKDDHVSVSIDEYAAAVYAEDNRPYIGRVLDADNESVYLDFMDPYVKEEPKNQHFRWPKRKDDVWVERENVLCVVAEPEETKRGYKLSEETQKCILELYSNWLKKNKV